jgi:hypothetical protein
MVYDPRTVLERYRMTVELSSEGEKPSCSLVADGLPPSNRAQCEALGCNANCFGLSTVAKEALAELAVIATDKPKRSQT